MCREIESFELGERPRDPLTVTYLRRLFFGLYEGNQNLVKKRVDDFNRITRLESQLKHAHDRIAELEAKVKMQGPSADVGLDGSPTQTPGVSSAGVPSYDGDVAPPASQADDRRVR
jgi:hypothetical protein